MIELSDGFTESCRSQGHESPLIGGKSMKEIPVSQQLGVKSGSYKQRSSTMESLTDSLGQPSMLTPQVKTQERKQTNNFSELCELAVQNECETRTSPYESFVNMNLENYGIIKKYCEELTETPFEEMLTTDTAIGKWLEEVVTSLTAELIPMIDDLARFKIDTSILDIYRNLLQLVGKRYTLLSTLTVGRSDSGLHDKR